MTFQVSVRQTAAVFAVIQWRRVRRRPTYAPYPGGGGFKHGENSLTFNYDESRGTVMEPDPDESLGGKGVVNSDNVCLIFHRHAAVKNGARPHLGIQRIADHEATLATAGPRCGDGRQRQDSGYVPPEPCAHRASWLGMIPRFQSSFILTEVIPMSDSNLHFAYFSSEILLPLTSIVATIAGVVMMLGRGSLRFVLHCVRRRRGRKNGVAGLSHPHCRVRDQAALRFPIAAHARDRDIGTLELTRRSFAGAEGRGYPRFS